MKEFKNKSEMTKNQMGSESYEAAAEELKKDEKKLAVSSTNEFLILTFCLRLEHHQEARKSLIRSFPSPPQPGWRPSNWKEDEE